ncbi:MAG: toxin-antitoxin system YwqK family antitoxin [Saprospiraceae bacterium]|nr:toxin-antitoxin system YwqK family antitoxin [Saprospiraceae bacterium]
MMISCSTDQKVTTFYESGAIKEQYLISKDSLKIGEYVRLAENGDTLEKSHYETGRLNGERILYYDGNKPEIREIYQMDLLNGPYQVYYEDGQVKLKMYYDQNVLHDLVVKYFPSGAVMEEVYFENNVEQGPFIEYYENGQKKWEGTYTNGDNEIGLLVHFSETGDTIRKMMCDDRYICRTIWENDQYKTSD